MEGHLTYTIDGAERKMFFGNYALEQTLEHFNSSVTDVAVLLNEKLFPFLRIFIYHAAAYPVLDEGKEVDFTPFDVHKWIDKTGGSNGEFLVKASREVYKVLGIVEGEESADQKKSQEENLIGETTS
jgi:hypothetical protein